VRDDDGNNNDDTATIELNSVDSNGSVCRTAPEALRRHTVLCVSTQVAWDVVSNVPLVTNLRQHFKRPVGDGPSPTSPSRSALRSCTVLLVSGKRMNACLV